MKRTQGAFLAVCAALLLLLAVEWLPSAEPVAVPVPKVVHAPAAGPAEEARSTADWKDTVLQRPLFNIGRRPPKVVGKAGPAAANGLPRLSGIIVTPFGRRAIFMPDGGKAQYLAEGASLDNDTIRAIAPDRVTLTGPKGDFVLRPTYDTKRTTSATPPAFGQPPMFPNGFPMGVPNPGFNPGLAPQVAPTAQGQNTNDDSGNDNGSPVATPGPPILPPGMPAFRPVPPHGRE